MAVKIRNNTGVMSALGNLNKNNTRVGKALRSVSTGLKIVGADDAASDYAISEKMRTQLRSLNQQIQNVQNGASLLKVAAGGVDSITDELRSLKELAIDAANDSNTDNDRRTMQKVFDQRIDNIDDIATSTNYNGRKLLDGGLRAYVEGDGVTKVTQVAKSSKSQTLIEANTSVAATTEVLSNVVNDLGTTSVARSTSTTTERNVVLGNVVEGAAPVTIGTVTTTANVSSEDAQYSESIPHSTSNTTLSEEVVPTSTSNTETTVSNMVEKSSVEYLDGGTVFEQSSKSYNLTTTTTNTSTVTTSSGTESTETWQEKKTKTTDYTEVVYLSTPIEETAADLAKEFTTEMQPIYIDDNTVASNTPAGLAANGVFKLAAGFSGTVNISASSPITIVGNGTHNNVQINISGATTDVYIKNLNINNAADKSAINFTSGGDHNLHLIGANYITNTKHGNNAEVNVGSGNLTICGNGSLNITATNAGTVHGAIIGSNNGATCGDITFDCGTTVNVTMNANASYRYAALIGSGYQGGCGNININGESATNYATVNTTRYYSSGTAQVEAANIGGGSASTIKDINIYSYAKVTATRTAGSNSVRFQANPIGPGYKSKGNGTVNVYANASVSATTQKPNGTTATAYTPSATTRTNSSGITATDPTQDKYYTPAYTKQTTTYSVTQTDYLDYTHKYQTLNVTRDITTETSTNQYKISESAMTSTTTITSYAPEHSLHFHTGSKAGQALRMHIEDMHADTLGIKNASVSTREAAVSAISVIDDAISYALDQATSLGAIVQRLEFTESNLVTAGENTQASESVIRDADMAKAMMDYTRSNVLQQAAQTMLAQANQNVSSVLSLLG